MDREAVRRAARPGSELEGLVRSAARPISQFPVQLSGTKRRQNANWSSPRLRRLRLFPARLFCIQDGAALRLFELLSRFRRQAAEVLPVVRRRASRGHASAPSALLTGRRAGGPRRSARVDSDRAGVVWPIAAARRATRSAACKGISAHAEAPDEF